MQIDVVQKDALSVPSDLLAVFQFQGAKPGACLSALDGKLGGKIGELLVEDAFEGKAGQTVLFPSFGSMKARKVAVIGVGDRKRFAPDAMRRIGGSLVKLAQNAKAVRVTVVMPENAGTPTELREVFQAFAEGVHLSAYRFHAYHGRLRKQEKLHHVESMSFCVVDARSAKTAKEAVQKAAALSEAVCFARDLVNTPSAQMAPMDLAEQAKLLAGKNVSMEILDKERMERLGMNAALAVAAGSDHPPVGVHLKYRVRGAKKTVMVVGKAVTFDSGGLSIKPAEGMMTMKIDMAGAATVLGLFHALPKLAPDVNVDGLFLAVENMPSGSAYRPGDVVTAMDGTTIEVLNTDAEGRVTLADALSYAKTQDPDYIIDLATLTGACVIALGEEISALFSNDRRLADRLLRAAEAAGEPLWELPLHEPYRELIKSKIADLKNIGGRPAGAITAAMFLKPFVGDIPWAHLDIAGPAFTERETRADLPYGASGYGVRLLAKFLESL